MVGSSTNVLRRLCCVQALGLSGCRIPLVKWNSLSAQLAGLPEPEQQRRRPFSVFCTADQVPKGRSGLTRTSQKEGRKEGGHSGYAKDFAKKKKDGYVHCAIEGGKSPKDPLSSECDAISVPFCYCPLYSRITCSFTSASSVYWIYVRSVVI